MGNTHHLPLLFYYFLYESLHFMGAMDRKEQNHFKFSYEIRYVPITPEFSIFQFNFTLPLTFNLILILFFKFGLIQH